MLNSLHAAALNRLQAAVLNSLQETERGSLQAAVLDSLQEASEIFRETQNLAVLRSLFRSTKKQTVLLSLQVFRSLCQMQSVLSHTWKRRNA